MKLDKILNKVMKKIRTGYSDSQVTQLWRKDVVSFPADIKVDVVNDGQIIIVHDVPITKVGVQAYSDGKYLKSKDAVAGMKADFSPISLSHPKKHFQEMNDDEADSLIVGHTANGYYEESNGKRYADFYLYTERMNKSADGQEVLRRLEEKKSVDVSIGFYVEAKAEKGTYDGEQYDYVDTEIRHDHTAMLPFEQGRWSYSQGVGMGADNNSNSEKACLDEEKTEQVITVEEKNNTAVDSLVASLKADVEQTKADLMAKDKALADAEAKIKAYADAEQKKEADARAVVINAIADRLFTEATDKESFVAVANKLDKESLEYFDNLLGQKIVVKDNKVNFSADKAEAKVMDDIIKMAKDKENQRLGKKK